MGGGRGRPVGGGAVADPGGDRDDPPPLEFVLILKTYGKCA